MANFLDEFLMRIGLDNSDFNRGTQANAADQARLRAESERTAQKLRAAADAAAQAQSQAASRAQAAAQAAAQTQARVARENATAARAAAADVAAATRAQVLVASAANGEEKRLAEEAAEAARGKAKASRAAADEAKKAGAVEVAVAREAALAARAASQVTDDAAKAKEVAANRAEKNAGDLRKKAKADDEEREKKQREGATKTRKALEEDSKRSADAVRGVKNEVLGLAAALVGAAGVGSFIDKVTGADAETGRLARGLGVAVDDLTALENAAERGGGTVSGIAQSFSGFVDQMEQFHATGQSATMPFIMALEKVKGGLSVVRDAAGNVLPPMEQFKRLLKDVHQLSVTQGAQAARFFGKGAGLDQATIDFAIKNDAAAQDRLLADARKDSATPADTAAAEKRQGAWNRLSEQAENLGRTLLTQATPALIEFGQALSVLLTDVETYTRENPRWTEQISEFAAEIKKLPAFLREVKDDAEWLAKKADGVAQSLGGWKVVIEGIIGLRLAAWAIGVIAPLGRLLAMLGAVPAAAAGGLSAVQALAAGTLLGLGAMAKGTTSEAGDFALREKDASEQAGPVEDTLGNGLRHRWNQLSSLWGGAPVHLTTKLEGLEEQYKKLKESGASPAVLKDYEKDIAAERAKLPGTKPALPAADATNSVDPAKKDGSPAPAKKTGATAAPEVGTLGNGWQTALALLSTIADATSRAVELLSDMTTAGNPGAASRVSPGRRDPAGNVGAALGRDAAGVSPDVAIHAEYAGSAEKNALADVIASTESGGKNVRFTGRAGGASISDLSRHPHVLELIPPGFAAAGKKSSAAGRYQFVGTTWDAVAKKMGLRDFSDKSQDQAFGHTASGVYRAKTGRDLQADLIAGKTDLLVSALHGTWESFTQASVVRLNKQLALMQGKQNDKTEIATGPGYLGNPVYDRFKSTHADGRLHKGDPQLRDLAQFEKQHPFNDPANIEYLRQHLGLGPIKVDPGLLAASRASSTAAVHNSNVATNHDNSVTQHTEIGQVHVHSAAKDATGIAADAHSALSKHSYVSAANTALA